MSPVKKTFSPNKKGSILKAIDGASPQKDKIVEKPINLNFKRKKVVEEPPAYTLLPT